MKKSLILALAVLATTAFATTPGNKEKKQKKGAKTEKLAPVKLTSQTDSLSFATGMYATHGLMDYVKQQYGIDSTNIDAFVSGLKEGLSHNIDKQLIARCGGMQIAQMLEERIYPQFSNDIKQSKISIDSLNFNHGFLAAVLGDTTTMAAPYADNYFKSTMQAAKQKAEKEYKAENEAWLKENATKEGVKTLPSGLQYKVLAEGKGAVATKDDKVTVRYSGRTIDGKEFDSSYRRTPNTTEFKPTQVIKGWTEALCMMPEGSKWELYIPQELAYGSRQAGQIKPYSTLIFTIELVKVEKEEAKDDKTETSSDKKSTTTQGKKTLPVKKRAAKK